MTKKQPASVILIERTPEVLTKEHKQFNSLIKRLESLEKNKLKKEQQLDQVLNFYKDDVLPLQNTKNEYRRKQIIVLYSIIKEEKVHVIAYQSKYIRIILEILLNEYINKVEKLDAKLTEIFKFIHQKTLKEKRKEDKKEAIEDLYHQFKEMNMDINMEDLKKMSDNEIFEKLHELNEKMNQNMNDFFNHKNTDKRKTKRQIEKEKEIEEIEKHNKKSLNKIYKQLAKILHPDLEHDKDMKIIKKELMKELTVAYQNKDMYTLLKLELKWMAKENDHFKQLSADKLQVYIDMLKKQITEMENEVYLVAQQPKYNIIRRFGNLFGISKTDLIREKNNIEIFIKNSTLLETLYKERKEKELKSFLSQMIQEYKYDYWI